jgi:hypothetical protein
MPMNGALIAGFCRQKPNRFNAGLAEARGASFTVEEQPLTIARECQQVVNPGVYRQNSKISILFQLGMAEGVSANDAKYSRNINQLNPYVDTYPQIDQRTGSGLRRSMATVRDPLPSFAATEISNKRTTLITGVTGSVHSKNIWWWISSFSMSVMVRIADSTRTSRHFREGPISNILGGLRDVRFTFQSRNSVAHLGCPLWAITDICAGQAQRIKGHSRRPLHYKLILFRLLAPSVFCASRADLAHQGQWRREEAWRGAVLRSRLQLQ